MDALSDLLQVVKLNGALFLDSRFTAPWCVESRPARESGGLFAGYEQSDGLFTVIDPRP